MTTKQIKSVAQLKKILSKHGPNSGYLDFAISLAGGGAYSRKEIMLVDDVFYINNCIDDSEQELTASQLMDEEYTNIGKAIKQGAFYQLIY